MTIAALGSLPERGSARAWLMAARLPTLPVAIAPVLVGASVASRSGHLRWSAIAAALFGALFIQIGTNFANDVFDYEKGADDERRLGPPRAVQSGLITPREMRLGMVVAFAIAMLSGAYLAWVAGPVIFAIGLVSILSGIAYTAGPYPLGYNGLGDVFVFVFFGLVAVAGTSWVAIASIPLEAWLAAIPVGALATCVLIVNNVRDYETDVDAGKRTLVVRFGRNFGVIEYALALALAFGTPLVLVGLGAPLAVLGALLPLPFGIVLWRRLARLRGPALNPVLAGSAKLLLLTSALLAFGFAIGR
jgi:1,4-dihydroxy-2-naphthoate polyprenyltransferase